MTMIARIAVALGTVLMLSACLVTPGKFTSTLDIRADRNFAFTYKGEVLALDMDNAMQGSGISDDSEMPTGQDSVYQTIALQQDAGKSPKKNDKAPAPPSDFGDVSGSSGDSKVKMEAIAAALMREKGFRSARYMGDGKFEIDYAIAGRLDHSFVFPFNLDAQIVIPFIALELRGDDRVRMKAPGYANDSSKTAGPMGGGAASEEAAQALDGTFTLTTDAEIVSQNQENGPTTITGGRQIIWKVDPLTSEAPMAVLKFPAK
jgi:hypothetical protein